MPRSRASLIDRIAVADVVRDIGDRDDQPEIPALALAIDGVVEILGGLAVDGDERQRRQVDAILAVGGAHLGRQALGLPLRFLRELERQRVLAQRDLDLDARIGGAAQHFLDARDRFAVGRGLLDDLGDDDLARPSRRSGRRAGTRKSWLMRRFSATMK